MNVAGLLFFDVPKTNYFTAFGITYMVLVVWFVMKPVNIWKNSEQVNSTEDCHASSNCHTPFKNWGVAVSAGGLRKIYYCSKSGLSSRSQVISSSRPNIDLFGGFRSTTRDAQTITRQFLSRSICKSSSPMAIMRAWRLFDSYQRLLFPCMKGIEAGRQSAVLNYWISKVWGRETLFKHSRLGLSCNYEPIIVKYGLSGCSPASTHEICHHTALVPLYLEFTRSSMLSIHLMLTWCFRSSCAAVLRSLGALELHIDVFTSHV